MGTVTGFIWVGKSLWESFSDIEETDWVKWNTFIIEWSQFPLHKFGDKVVFDNNIDLHAWAIGHFTVMDGSEVDGDLVLIQTFMLYYVNQVILMLTSSFQEQFP